MFVVHSSFIGFSIIIAFQQTQTVCTNLLLNFFFLYYTNSYFFITTETSLNNWRHGIRWLFFLTGIGHIVVWYEYNIVISSAVPGLLFLLFIGLWNSNFTLRNGSRLNEKLVDEGKYIESEGAAREWSNVVIVIVIFII